MRRRRFISSPPEPHSRRRHFRAGGDAIEVASNAITTLRYTSQSGEHF